MRAFNMPLTDEALEEVKNVIQSYDSSGVHENGITLSGFFDLHEVGFGLVGLDHDEILGIHATRSSRDRMD